MRLSVVLPCLLACGSPPPPAPVELTRVEDAPARGDALAVEKVSAPASVDGLGGTNAGSVALFAGGRVYEWIGGRLEPRTLYAVGSDPTSLGAVHAIAPRHSGGAWVAAESGLFVLDGLYVSRSPLPGASGPVRSAIEAKEGLLAGLWLAADAGLYRRTPDALEKYQLLDSTAAPRAIAVDAQGSSAFVLAGDQLFLLTHLDGKLVSETPPLELTGVTAVGAGKGRLYAACEQGVLEWSAGKSPAWTLYTLGGQAARALAVDALSGAAWIRTDADLVKLEDGALTAHSAPALSGVTERMALATSGDLWLARAAELHRFKIGVGSVDVTFDRDLKPWLTTNCTRCHADFTSYEVFAPKAEAALAKVKAGDMPRCSGGVVCPVEQRLSAEQYAVLEGWIRGGKAR